MSQLSWKKNHDSLRSERIAGGILPRVLNSFDMVAIFVAIVLFIVNAGAITAAGPAAYLYWGLGFLSFLIPGAIVTAQLGLLFPGEGSIYVWTTRAFGDFVGFLGGFCAWWPGILVMIATSGYAVVFIEKLGSLFRQSPLNDAGSQGLVIILIITFSLLLSILRFRTTQNMVNIIVLMYGAAILLIGLAGVVWLLRGNVSATNLSLQTGNWALNGKNITNYGVTILALLGIEVPLNMGVEIRTVRSITRYLFWGSLTVMIAYLIGTFGVMVAAPAKVLNPSTAMIDAIQQGFGPAGTFLAAMADLIFIGFFIFATVVYNYAFSRLLFVSGLDRRLPAAVSKINRNKVPWIAILTQSMIAALISAVIFLLAHIVMPNVDPVIVATNISNAIQAGVTVIWCISMVLLFLDVLVIRQKYSSAFHQVRLAPDWVFYLCALFGILASLIGIASLFTSPWGSWTNTLPSISWVFWIVGIAIISLAAGVTVFYLGRKTLESHLTDEEIIAEITR
jgi:amino acid transporter